MPEVRLAWRAVLCCGSHDSHVVAGIAPTGEQRAVARAVGRDLRIYTLPGTGGRAASQWAGYAGAAPTLGVVPLSAPRPGEPWDSMLTVTLSEAADLPQLVQELSDGSPEDYPFLAMVNAGPEAERRFFEALVALPPPADLADLLAGARGLSGLLAAPR
ncbi:MAG: hypothetical protein WD749_04705 [Phycisphaerales bacterium]